MKRDRDAIILRMWLTAACLLPGTAERIHAGESFQQAQTLIQEGRDAEAFAQLLTVPGAEYLAVRLARPHAEEFLAALRARAGQIPLARARLVEGDLLLALGRRAEALQCYRQVVARIGTKPDEGWEQEFVPADEYPAEPPTQDNRYESLPLSQSPVRAFEAGPGSHRDNWLIRRFIALEAWDDAAGEFARIWEIHRRDIQPAGFDGRALQFAIDYAYFLKRRGQTEKMLSVLLEPIAIMDMDRNPNLVERNLPAEDVRSRDSKRISPRVARRSGMLWGASAGISRKEYLRLAYGEFKAAGKTDLLFTTVQDQISKGQNRARRVLARLYTHDGRLDDALAMELAFLAHSDYDALTTAYRRGVAYEDAGKLTEAAAEYEKTLALPYSPPVLPDADEETVQSRMMSQAVFFPPDPRSPAGQTAFQQNVMERLQRIYAALGRTDEAVDSSLRQLEANERLLENFDTLNQVARRFITAGEEGRFKVWLVQRAAQVSSPAARANLCWFAGDLEGTARALAVSVSQRADEPVSSPWLEPWKARFRQAGKEPYRMLLKMLIEANPKDVITRLEWLDIEGVHEDPEVIHTFELLLDSDAPSVFARGKGYQNRTQFRNYFDFAYRLTRLYERTAGSEDKLLALGFRILEGQKPFQGSDDLLRNYRANWNISTISGEVLPQDILNCLYVFLAHLRRPQDIERAISLAEKTGNIPLINQVHRLQPQQGIDRIDPATGHRLKYDAVEVRTLGLPEGVRALTNRDDVRAIAPVVRWDEGGEGPDQVWLGTSWGLIRYKTEDRSGRRLQILQVPLGVAATAFCQTPAGLYVGTRDGLYRLDDPNGDNPMPVRIGVEATDGKDRERVQPTVNRQGEIREVRVHEPFNVTQLLWWREALWIGAGDAVYRYRPDTREAQYYGPQERSVGFFVGFGRLWFGRSVLDPLTGEVKAIDPDIGTDQWRLIGATSKEIWADVWVDDKLRHRPALLNPQTLHLRVLPIVDARRSQMLLNEELRLLGEFEDRAWLVCDNPYVVVVYDRGRDELRIHDGPLPSPEGWALYDWLQRSLAAVKLDLSGDRGPKFTCVPISGGRLIVGNAIVREWAEDNLGFDDDTGMSHHVQDLEGGLFEIDPATATWRKIGSPDEELTDFYVKKLVRDGSRLYVCTNGGVTIVSLPDGAVVGRMTVSDGLPSNKVEDVARIGDRLYMACELGDEGGGLAIQDLTTGLIQVMTIADGLKSNKIKRLRVRGSKLHILYGTTYRVRAHGTPLQDSIVAPVAEEVKRRGENSPPDERVRTFKSSILDVQTGRLENGDEVLPAAYRPELTGGPLPVLGGLALCSEDVATPDSSRRRFIGGTHGLLICSAAADPIATRLRWPQEQVRTVQSVEQAQAAEAAKIAIPQSMSPDQLRQFVANRNPYVVAQALAATRMRVLEGYTEYTPIVAGCVTHPHYRVRSTAVWLLSKTRSTAAIDALKTALNDSDFSIRAIAAISLANRGQTPAMSYFEEIFKRDTQGGNLPFGATSSIGMEVSPTQVYEALAHDATPEVFALLMKYPPHVRAYDNATKVYPPLGESLRRHPEAADILLRAADTRPPDLSNRDFARHVFRFAGKEMLPILHKALASNDRVIRSNAARACGAIGDPSSIPDLIRALDMESGLARASIVWAVGELRAREAVPDFIRLYVDASNDERRRRGSGFLAAQSSAAIQAQYDSLSNLDALGANWDELKEAVLPVLVDPQKDEELLSPHLILEAVSKIGSDETQEFYRTLAGEKDTEARSEAAIHLAEGSPANRQQNVAILNNLLADSSPAVRMHAAVSLLILGENTGKQAILEWLGSTSVGDKEFILRELGRVKEASRLEFAQDQIAKIASDANLPERIRNLAGSLLRVERK